MIKKIASQIPVIFLKEKDSFIAYSPAVDLTTYGKSLEEAKKNFEEAFSLFVSECIDMGTLDEVLESCGWVKIKNKKWEPPIYIGNDDVKIPAELAAAVA
jgi:hypothetical protein